MPRRRQGPVPSLQHHKPSNRARVWIQGHTYWLGKWGTPEAQLAYNRLIGEYLATGRIATTRPEPVAEAITEVVVSPSRRTVARHVPPADDVRIPGALTIIELISLYLEYCQTYYRDPSGRQTSTYGNALQASRALRPFHDTLASSFGPKRLGMIRDSEAAAGRPRVGCNAILKHVRRVFQWAESQELVPRGTYNSLKTVEPLKKGRTVAPELPPVKPIDEEIVEATLPYLAEVVADMIRFQRLTGSRPGEVCGLRPADTDRSGPTWKWQPPNHKNSWRDADRVIMIGPRAPKLIQKYLLRDAEAYCFSPKEAERKRSKLRRLARKSPLTTSQRARKPKRHGRRRPRDAYVTASYRHAITRAVGLLNKDRKKKDHRAAPIPDWSPKQLRHAAGPPRSRPDAALCAA